MANRDNKKHSEKGHQVIISPEMKRELFELVKAGDKISAIVRLREEYGLDLLKAKNFLEEISQNW